MNPVNGAPQVAAEVQQQIFTAPAPATGQASELQIVRFENVSRFYGDVLGVNRVNLSIAPGITSLVGPNGSGKTTIMNLMAGLILPTEGQIRVLGVSPQDPERLFRVLGYCTQFDSFPSGLTGFQFLNSTLRFHGLSRQDAEERSWQALQRVRMQDAAHRKVAAYSKGMRQRVKLAQAIAHQPRVLVLDEPLNGLDPMARAETIALFRELAAGGMLVIVSSHILHEVDQISDQVILINQGYIVAEGEIRNVRSEVKSQPVQMLVQCDQPRLVARHMLASESVVEASLLPDGNSVMFRTTSANDFCKVFQATVQVLGVRVEMLRPNDGDADALYSYLIGQNGAIS
jgi:ABC-2 type transport system ATP-binding protein